MPRKCLFCENTADSPEHLWPNWIIKSLDRQEPIVRSINNQSLGTPFVGAIEIKCVCSECNHGWMSNLEGVVKPFIEPILHDNAGSLDKEQQLVLAAWTVKIAMVLEGARRDREHFYTRVEAESLRLRGAIPARSLIWLGRMAEGGLHAAGIDLRFNVDNIPKVANGCVTTIVVGHLILQVVTAHYPPRFSNITVGVHCKDGPWQESLLGIWPSVPKVDWPPPLEFSLRGRLPLALLGDRWRYGTRIET